MSLKQIKLKPWQYGLALLSIITLIFLGIYLVRGDQIRFRRFSESLFRSELAGDALGLHYTLAYPENYGIEAAGSLSLYTPGSEAADNSGEIRSALASLSRISPERLDGEDAFAFGLLVRYLERRLAGSNFHYYDEPFSPGSGIQSNLPILLADYTFRRKEDVENYLSILDQTDEYLEGLLQYEVEKADAGLFMADYSAAKVIKQCDSIMDKKLLSQGTHFLHTTFEERVTKLVQDGELSRQEADYYISENDRLLVTVLQPAYEQAADTFTVLEGKGENSQGLYYFPQGREYYEYLLSSSTGSDRPVSEIKRLLYEDFQKNYNAMLALIAKYPQLADSSLVPSLDLPLTEPSQMLKDLQGRMSEDFPPFPSKDGSFKTSVTVKKVSPSMEDYCSPAYYLTPPIDDMENNIIYINGKSRPDNLTLYTTLAHEGYPGHLYQTVYSQLYFNSSRAPLVRHLLHYGGYVEGWAYYVEDLSYQYAASSQQADSPLAAYCESSRLGRNIHLCLYSLLDLAIHYDGATPEQTAKILRSIGITSPSAVQSIYQYIAEEPVNYLKYYLGYLEITLLKEKAEALWGDEFSPYRFHQFILETGPADFTGLNERLQQER